MARIGIVIPEKLLLSIDHHSQASGYSRSEFIRYAIRQVIEKKGTNEFPKQVYKTFSPTASSRTS